jgi:hypothetical protein
LLLSSMVKAFLLCPSALMLKSQHSASYLGVPATLSKDPQISVSLGIFSWGYQFPQRGILPPPGTWLWLGPFNCDSSPGASPHFQVQSREVIRL